MSESLKLLNQSLKENRISALKEIVKSENFLSENHVILTTIFILHFLFHPIHRLQLFILQPKLDFVQQVL